MFESKTFRYVPLTAIILISVIFRFVYLDRLPNAIGGDELVYPITAKSVALTGRDITGTWNILSLLIFRYPPNQQSAELPYFLHLPLAAIAPFSLLTAHLPFALFSVGIAILLYLISGLLFGEAAAIATGFVAAVNPWLVVMGRTGYETTPATFFYLLGLYILLRTSSWNLLWSVIPFTLAFYSYIATKVIFFPFLIVSIVLAYILHKKKNALPYWLFVLYTVLFLFFFFICIRTVSNSIRVSDILLPNVQELVNKLVRILSPKYLFIDGDLFFPVRGHSFFYPFDFVCLTVGIFYLFIKKRLLFWFMVAYILIGTFPHLVFKLQGDYSLHISMMFPIMIIVIGYGISELFKLRIKMLSVIVGSLVIFLYVISVANFTHIYFYKYPLQEYGDFHMRILSKYLQFAKKEKSSIMFYSSSNRDILNKYLFYANALNVQNIKNLQKIGQSDHFTFDAIQFGSCGDILPTTNISAVSIIDSLTCPPSANGVHVSISRLIDGGEIYKIYNDNVCSNYVLKRFPANLTMADFSVEQLSKEQFCETYISRL